MKQPRFLAPSIALALALLTAIGAAGGPRAANAQGASSLNMRLVGTNDLQARSTYQPTLHKYPNNRYVLFTGHHALAKQGEGLLPNGQLLPSLNPLTGMNELNGTSIVDVTNPRNPQYLFHLPVPDGVAGGAQMVRLATATHCRSTMARFTCCAPTPIPRTRSGTSQTRAIPRECALLPAATQ